MFVVHIESLKATSLIHAAKYAKVNTTATNVTTSSTTEEAIKEGLPEIYQKEEGVSLILQTDLNAAYTHVLQKG